MEQRWRNIICEITRATQQHGLLCSLRNRSDQSGWSIKIPNTRLAKDMGRTLVNAGLPQHTTSLRTVQA